MRLIPLQNVPNQSFTVQIDQTFYGIRIHACGSGDSQVMAVSVSINDEVIVSSARTVCGFPIIPTLYQQNGNFTFITTDDALPDWQQFGVSQYLVYASQAELEVLDAATA